MCSCKGGLWTMTNNHQLLLQSGRNHLCTVQLPCEKDKRQTGTGAKCISSSPCPIKGPKCRSSHSPIGEKTAKFCSVSSGTVSSSDSFDGWTNVTARTNQT